MCVSHGIKWLKTGDHTNKLTRTHVIFWTHVCIFVFGFMCESLCMCARVCVWACHVSGSVCVCVSAWDCIGLDSCSWVPWKPIIQARHAYRCTLVYESRIMLLYEMQRKIYPSAFMCMRAYTYACVCVHFCLFLLLHTHSSASVCIGMCAHSTCAYVCHSQRSIVLVSPNNLKLEYFRNSAHIFCWFSLWQ